MKRSRAEVCRVSPPSMSRSRSKTSSTWRPTSSEASRQSTPSVRAISRAAPLVMPITRPLPSSVSAASGSTSRNSGLSDRRSTQSRRLSAMMLAISIRRAAWRTRFSAITWLSRGAGELSSEMSSTAESCPDVS
ncbi:hypothetical protein [Mangrovicoccus ximenensis]|uniref:hypothetical protein n=1 Tax=Mangrovicoccus ximenensis TaxID=1911570 RepID=UPI001F35D338|nr:hypothetical protein [Mangrovicoccus ximenensis]